MYKAHINDKTNAIQTVKTHCLNTGELSKEFSINPLKNLLYAIGVLHDIGKYQKSFQKKINGFDYIRIEHSICGAIEAEKYYDKVSALLIKYCIAGHHSGIPDGGFPNDTDSSLWGRMNHETEDYSAYKEDFQPPKFDEAKLLTFLTENVTSKHQAIEKFAFFVRYCFSCLTDADSIDTAEFCNGNYEKTLKADFFTCLNDINIKLSSFEPITQLQKARALLQKKVFEQEKIDSDIYLMNMPTGSGKTLCSMKFALERALLTHKKRIIYIIPYNSIIDQTAAIFETLFGDHAEILRHQSTFDYNDNNDYSEDYKNIVRYASENWDAQIIITTAVQFFESMYANKRRKLRKMHNLAESILVFDEAHLMPVKFLQPCLTAISYITKYLNSEAIFLTATMPDFKKLITQYSFEKCAIANLVDHTSDFSFFKKCKYIYWNTKSHIELLGLARDYPSKLIVVNKRKEARKIFELCSGKKYHLSTYMTAYDRKNVIDAVQQELDMLQKDYPGYKNVPQERRITVVSTSLIEAGVDLDFYSVIRELAGLDSILQAGGRCNREGKRSNAEVFIFQAEEYLFNASSDEKINITKSLLNKYSDISSPECIKEYYDRLYFARKDEICAQSISNMCTGIQNIPFKEYADKFELIESDTVSIVAERDDNSHKLIEGLKITGLCSTRKLQKYTFSIYRYELEQLIKQNAVKEYGGGIWCLVNNDYYDENIGVVFEGKDYFI